MPRKGRMRDVFHNTRLDNARGVEFASEKPSMSLCSPKDLDGRCASSCWPVVRVRPRGCDVDEDGFARVDEDRRCRRSSVSILFSGSNTCSGVGIGVFESSNVAGILGQ